MAKNRHFAAWTGDIQRVDPTRIGGGVVTEHMHGDQPTTYTMPPDETERYRGLGEAAAQRQAYQANFDKALVDEKFGEQARRSQLDAAGQMRLAAQGGAPSQAAILGNQAAGQSLQSQMAAGANARGMGQAAAQMQAAGATGQQQLGAMGQYAGMRGAEMGRAQGAYGQAGGTLRAGDYAQQGMAQQRAEAQGQAEATQRRLNQEAQMGYEQMGINNQQAQSDSDARNAAIQAQRNATSDAAFDARNARYQQLAVSGMSAMATMGAGSDERMKQDVVPLGSPDGMERHWDRDVAKAAPDTTSGASLAGPAPKYSNAKEAAPRAKTSLAQAAAKKRPSDDELKRMADEMLAERRASVDAGPSVGRQAPAWLDDYMASDIRTKDGCRPLTPQERAEDEAATAKFMAGSKPVEANPEADRADMESALWHAKERAKEEAAAEKRRVQAPAIEYADQADESMQGRASMLAGVPLVGKWAQGKVDARRAESDDAKTERAIHDKKSEAEFLATRKSVDDWASSHLPESVRTAAVQYPAGIGYRPQHDSRQASSVRQPTSVTRETVRQPKSFTRGEGDMGAALEQGLKPFEYEYKPGFREAEGQAPGEKNVGPMAQNMASNPITGSAVEQGPDGMLRMSIPKTVKMNSAGIGYLAAKQRKLEEELARVKGGR